MKALPKNRQSPTNCKGGWFYVTRTGIDVVAPPRGNGIASVSRSQLIAALKVMGKSTSKNRGGVKNG